MPTVTTYGTVQASQSNLRNRPAVPDMDYVTENENVDVGFQDCVEQIVDAIEVKTPAMIERDSGNVDALFDRLVAMGKERDRLIHQLHRMTQRFNAFEDVMFGLVKKQLLKGDRQMYDLLSAKFTTLLDNTP